MICRAKWGLGDLVRECHSKWTSLYKKLKKKAALVSVCRRSFSFETRVERGDLYGLH